MTLIYPAERSIEINYTKYIGEAGAVLPKPLKLNTIVPPNTVGDDYIYIHGPEVTDLEIELLDKNLEVIDSRIITLDGTNPEHILLTSDVAKEIFAIRAMDINENDIDWEGVYDTAPQTINISWKDSSSKSVINYISFINGVEVIEGIANTGAGSYRFSVPVQHNYTDDNTTIVIYGIDKDGRYITTGSVTF